MLYSFTTADLTLRTLQAYQENFKAAVLAAERSLLFTLGFNFRIDTPHKCLLHELQGVAKSLKAPIEQACASAAAADLQPSHVQQAAYDVCNERYIPINTLPYSAFTLLHLSGLCLANVSTSVFLCCLTCTLVTIFLWSKVWDLHSSCLMGCVSCSLRCDVVMTHTPLEIAIASMYFSLKYHNISHLMPGGMQWYSQWSVTEDRIKGKHGRLCLVSTSRCAALPQCYAVLSALPSDD